MKQYLLLLGVLAAIIATVVVINPRCNLTDTDPTSKGETTITTGTIGELQVITPAPVKRYFFVGYDVSHSDGHNMNRSYGNWYVSADGMPSYEDLKKLATQNFLGDVKGAKPKDVIITSLFEFKDSVEYGSFTKGLKSNQHLK